jgi:hypothetical protein
MRHPIQLPNYIWLPHGILGVFNTILYENEFQNPQIFQKTFSRAIYFIYYFTITKKFKAAKVRI